MDPALYYKIYREGMDKQVIPRHTEYIKFYHLYNLIKDYVWRD